MRETGEGVRNNITFNRRVCFSCEKQARSSRVVLPRKSKAGKHGLVFLQFISLSSSACFFDPMIYSFPSGLLQKVPDIRQSNIGSLRPCAVSWDVQTGRLQRFRPEEAAVKVSPRPSLFGGGDVRLWMANDECLPQPWTTFNQSQQSPESKKVISPTHFPTHFGPTSQRTPPEASLARLRALGASGHTSTGGETQGVGHLGGSKTLNAPERCAAPNLSRLSPRARIP